MNNLEYPDKGKSGVSRYDKEGEEWITLKEASQISGYSPDYIGELIRKGKIPGKQVYFNIAWLTTKRAILEYKEKQGKRRKKLSKKEKLLEAFDEIRKKILIQFEILKLFFKTFKSTLLIFTLFVIILTMAFYFLIFSFYQKSASSNIYQKKDFEKTENITF